MSVTFVSRSPLVPILMSVDPRRVWKSFSDDLGTVSDMLSLPVSEHCPTGRTRPSCERATSKGVKFNLDVVLCVE